MNLDEHLVVPDGRPPLQRSERRPVGRIWSGPPPAYGHSSGRPGSAQARWNDSVGTTAALVAGVPKIGPLNDAKAEVLAFTAFPRSHDVSGHPRCRSC